MPLRVRSVLVAATTSIGMLMSLSPAQAEIVSRESDITGIRLGQSFYVDDGSCPGGQIKEITGTKLSPTGVLSIKKCVPRKNVKR